MNAPYIEIDLASQRLCLRDDSGLLMEAGISSARNGPGERSGSECTPRGWHVIRAKIGAGCHVNTVFSARRSTGEIYSKELAERSPGRDWILTRILWLSGTEKGKNRLGDVDTMRRYIYIHGSPDEDAIGQAGSHGCIRMHNKDVMRLFDLVNVGTRVHVMEGT